LEATPESIEADADNENGELINAILVKGINEVIASVF